MTVPLPTTGAVTVVLVETMTICELLLFEFPVAAVAVWLSKSASEPKPKVDSLGLVWKISRADIWFVDMPCVISGLERKLRELSLGKSWLGQESIVGEKERKGGGASR